MACPSEPVNFRNFTILYDYNSEIKMVINSTYVVYGVVFVQVLFSLVQRVPGVVDLTSFVKSADDVPHLMYSVLSFTQNRIMK